MAGMQPLLEIEMQRKAWTRLVPRSCQAQPQRRKRLPSKCGYLSERMTYSCSVTLFIVSITMVSTRVLNVTNIHICLGELPWPRSASDYVCVSYQSVDF